MKFPLISAILTAAFLNLLNTQAEEHLGPPVYLAALYEIGGNAVLHWKYNIARPEFVEVKVTDFGGAEIARVRRPLRRTDVTGKTGPFRLVPLLADGRAGTEVDVPVGPTSSLASRETSPKTPAGITPKEVPLDPAPAISRIGIKQWDGRAEFVNLASGKVFHPIGINYVPLRYADHAAFEAATSAGDGFYDPLEAESVLRLLRKNGYNTVRVFLTGRTAKNPGLSGEADTVGIYTPYLDNLADFLQRASENGIYVIPNFGDADLPQNKFFLEKLGHKNGTENLFREPGLVAFREMVASTLGYLKAKNPDLLKAILGVQFNNEASAKLTRWPFSESGPVTTANGKTYDMSVPADRVRCYEDGLIFFYQQMCAAVKEVDRNLLTCEGVFVAAAVGRDHRLGAETFKPENLAKGFDWEKSTGLRVPPSLTVLAASPLDFVDIHLYPAGPLADFHRDVAGLLDSSRYKDALALGLGSKKPVILGEFGAFKIHVKNDTSDGMAGAMRRWSETRRLACENFGFVGYLGWSLETFEQVDIFQALAFDPGFLRRFREEYTWPGKAAISAPNSSAAAKSPLVLTEVPPTGAAKGFLIPQALTR